MTYMTYSQEDDFIGNTIRPHGDNLDTDSIRGTRGNVRGQIGYRESKVVQTVNENDGYNSEDERRVTQATCSRRMDERVYEVNTHRHCV